MAAVKQTIMPISEIPKYVEPPRFAVAFKCSCDHDPCIGAIDYGTGLVYWYVLSSQFRYCPQCGARLLSCDVTEMVQRVRKKWHKVRFCGLKENERRLDLNQKFFEEEHGKGTFMREHPDPSFIEGGH